MKKKDVVQPTKFKISKLTQRRNDWNISQGLSIGCEDKEKRKQLWGKKNLMIQPMKLIQHAGQSREELAQLRKKCRNASSFVL